MRDAMDRLQSPLARARGLGSVHEGAHHWLMERVTSVALVPLTLWLVWSVIGLRGADYEVFTFWMSRPWNAALMILTVAIGFLHAVSGLQVVIEDYVASHSTKLLTIIAVKLAFAAMGVIAVFSILKVAL